MASSDNVHSPIYFLDVLGRRPFQKNLSMISWALPTPPINPKWLVHNIVPPFKRASIWRINMNWLLENFPPPINPPPTPGQAYVDGAMLKMTGDQGVLLVCVCVKNRLRPMCVYGWVNFVCAGESDLCAQVSQICVRRWATSVCVGESDLCAWLSLGCVRRWARSVCAAESLTIFILGFSIFNKPTSYWGFPMVFLWFGVPPLNV